MDSSADRWFRFGVGLMIGGLVGQLVAAVLRVYGF
jgi:hypothetical protein